MLNIGIVASSKLQETYFFNTTTAVSQTFSSRGTAIDSEGNLIVVGGISSGTTGMFVIKYDSDGDIVWQKLIPDTAGTYFASVEVNASNDIFLAGASYSAGWYSCYVVKMNSAGSIQWQNYIGTGAAIFEAYDLALDSTGNINVCGRVSNDGFLYQLDSSGALNWQRTLAGSSIGSDIARSVVCDSSNNIYTAVYSRETASASFDVTVISHDVNGNILWQQKYVTADPDTPMRMVLDPSGDLILCGQTRNTTIGATVGFVMKVSGTTGAINWERNITGTSFAINNVEGGCDVDSLGNVYALTRKPVGGQNRSIIMKWNSSGTHQYTREITAGSTSTNQYAQSLKIKSNNMYFTLYTNTPTNALNGKLKTSGAGTGIYTLTGFSSISYQTDATTDIAGTITTSAGTMTQTTSTYTLVSDTKTANTTTYTNYKVIVP